MQGRLVIAVFILVALGSVFNRGNQYTIAEHTENPASATSDKHVATVRPYLPVEIVPSHGTPAKLQCGNKPTIYTYDPKLDHVARLIKREGLFEPHLVRTMMRLLRHFSPSCTCHPTLLDLGANVGVFSLCAASAGYQTVSFEAEPHTAQLFASSVHLNKLQDKVTLFHVALDGPGHPSTVCMLSHKTNMGATTAKYDSSKCSPETNVTVSTVDELTEQLGDLRSLLFLKVDVEGFEGAAFLGLKQTLQNTAPCFGLVELSAPQLNPGAPQDFMAAVTVLHEVGYHLLLDVKAVPVIVQQLVFSGWVVDSAEQRHKLEQAVEQLVAKQGIEVEQLEQLVRGQGQANIIVVHPNLTACVARVATACETPCS